MRINLPIVFAGVIIGSTLIGAGEDTARVEGGTVGELARQRVPGGLRGKVVLVDFWEDTCIKSDSGPCRLSRRGIATMPRSASS